MLDPAGYLRDLLTEIKDLVLRKDIQDAIDAICEKSYAQGRQDKYVDMVTRRSDVPHES